MDATYLFPDRPIDIARRIEARLGLPEKEASHFTPHVSKHVPNIAAVLGGGTAGLLALQALEFLKKNPQVFEDIGFSGIELSLFLAKHWEGITMTHHLVEFVGLSNTVTLLTKTGGFTLDHWGWLWDVLGEFVDKHALAFEIFEGLGTAGASWYAAVKIKKLFNAINSKNRERFEELAKEEALVKQSQELLERAIPAAQLTPLFRNIDQRHWK